MLTKRDLLHSAALTTITVATTRPLPAQAQVSANRPGFFKAKDIAEAGFIYGLPIVMAYGIMYEYAADRKSDQPISGKLADAVRHEDEPGRFPNSLHPEQIAGR
jgi:hypothetical protein